MKDLLNLQFSDTFETSVLQILLLLLLIPMIRMLYSCIFKDLFINMRLSFCEYVFKKGINVRVNPRFRSVNSEIESLVNSRTQSETTISDLHSRIMKLEWETLSIGSIYNSCGDDILVLKLNANGKKHRGLIVKTKVEVLFHYNLRETILDD